MTAPSGWCVTGSAAAPMPASGPSRNSCTRRTGCSLRHLTAGSVRVPRLARPVASVALDEPMQDGMRVDDVTAAGQGLEPAGLIWLEVARGLVNPYRGTKPGRGRVRGGLGGAELR